MSALVPSSPPHVNPSSFDSPTFGHDDGQLQSSVPSQLRSREWFGGTSVSALVKRAVDLTGALVGLTLLTPVILVIALLIRLEGRGPILFRQLRRGYRGRLFRVIKFRTMSVDAEQRLIALEESNESAGGVLFKLRHDPRVTRLGQFLRRYSLDELPQLINILCGEMSLVGPRPLQLRDSDKLMALDPRAYACRLEVMPGLTGPWQVGGRSEVDYQRMVELDVDYAENWSIGRDLRIIGKTFFVVLLRRGAY
jgi:lipopolysaccharide/colanic/teichoic acid biosynthesis glycosyltransferase